MVQSEDRKQKPNTVHRLETQRGYAEDKAETGTQFRDKAVTGIQFRDKAEPGTQCRDNADTGTQF